MSLPIAFVICFALTDFFQALGANANGDIISDASAAFQTQND